MIYIGVFFENTGSQLSHLEPSIHPASPGSLSLSLSGGGGAYVRSWGVRRRISLPRRRRRSLFFHRLKWSTSNLGLGASFPPLPYTPGRGNQKHIVGPYPYWDGFFIFFSGQWKLAPLLSLSLSLSRPLPPSLRNVSPVINETGIPRHTFFHSRYTRTLAVIDSRFQFRGSVEVHWYFFPFSLLLFSSQSKFEWSRSGGKKAKDRYQLVT